MLKEARPPLDQLSGWAARTLTCDDAVASKAMANTWRAYDCLAASAKRGGQMSEPGAVGN